MTTDLKSLVAGPAALALGISLALGGAAAAADQTIGIGKSATISLPGNPSTGYKWQLNTAASSGLEKVQVHALGYSAPPKKSGEPRVIGAPETFRFKVTCLKTGAANFSFDYLRPWEGKPLRSQSHKINCR